MTKIEKVDLVKETVDKFWESIVDIIEELPIDKQIELTLKRNEFYFNKSWEIAEEK